MSGVNRRWGRARITPIGLIPLIAMASLSGCGGTPAPTGPAISQNQAEVDGYNALVADGVKGDPTTLTAVLLSTAKTDALLGQAPGAPAWLVIEDGNFAVPRRDADDSSSSPAVAAFINSQTGKVLDLMWTAPVGY